MRLGNEDSLHADANEHRGLFIVADGMGGHAAGEVASSMAVEIIARELAELDDIERSDATRRVADALRVANRAVYERTMREMEKLGMGSTASVLLLSDTRYVIGHIGDSRIYLFRNGAIQQLTKDHSIVQEHLDAGLITAEQARHHPQSNVITRCVGINDTVDADVYAGSTEIGDVFLLASDGLTGMVDDRRLQQLLAARTAPKRVVDALISEANARGGVDNITAIVVYVIADDMVITGSHRVLFPDAHSDG